jgi:hypothetical protein
MATAFSNPLAIRSGWDALIKINYSAAEVPKKPQQSGRSGRDSRRPTAHLPSYNYLFVEVSLCSIVV